MIDEIVYEEKNGLKRLAGLTKGVLSELVIQETDKANEGNIYLGKITKKIQTANGKEGYFVNIGAEKEAFINAEERELEDLKAHEGQDIVVQVIQEQRAEKGARLSRYLQLAGVNLVYCPYGDEIEVSSKIEDEHIRDLLGQTVEKYAPNGGWIVRTHAAVVETKDIVIELEQLRQRFEQISLQAKSLKAPALLAAKDNMLEEFICLHSDDLQHITLNNHILEQNLAAQGFGVVYNSAPFETFGLEDKIAEALCKVVKLKCGGRVIIEETKALTAIDVDSGEGTAQGGFGRLNQEAAEEIAHQIILRNLSGKIMIDFAGMSEFRFLKPVMDILEKALAKDVARAKVLGLSRAGNVEVVRMRRRPSLSDVLTEECATCAGTGRVEK
jgi:ribonuclease G